MLSYVEDVIIAAIVNTLSVTVFVGQCAGLLMFCLLCNHSTYVTPPYALFSF